MKIAAFWVSIALLVPQVIAISATSTASMAPSCTASLIASLCRYQDPGPEFAVAIESRASCWDYCNAHPPCDFVIFNAGNPYTGTGTCWLYPGETYDPSKGSSSCTDPNGELSVYSKPMCSGGSATTTAGGCAATATPSAIASVCGYPAPGDCFYDCTASEGAPDCLSQCAMADSCSYVVFNSHNPSNSPYASGTCWIYANGTFDAVSATTCSGAPDQFVYKNLCPKPSPSSSSHSSSATGSSSTGTTGTASGSTTSAATGSNGTATTGNASGSTTSNKNSAPAGRSLTNPLAVGVAILMWQAL